MDNKIKYCQKCGAENSIDAIYCSKCGNNFIDTTILKENKRVSGFATAGFIMSILAWLLDYTTTLYDIDFFLGIIFCFLGIHYTKHGEQKGRGLAIFGIISFVLVFVCMIFSAMVGTL